MPQILASHYAFAPFAISQRSVKAAAAELFAGKIPDLERLLDVFDNARIATRRLMMPLDWYRQEASVAVRNRIYQEQGGELLLAAAGASLDGAGLTPEQIDQVIFVSSTGLATPTLDVRLINELGLRRNVSRLPLWGLGCAAGAAGLSRAFEFCLMRPSARVLVAALECCSLNFLNGDMSRKNLVATALFSDGAAAAVVAGHETSEGTVQILATRSYLFPGSSRIMGWDFLDEGMALVLSPRLPVLVKNELANEVDALLTLGGVRRSDVVHYLFHPGGAKIIDACSAALGLTSNDLALSEIELGEHGNTSSVSVLAVLARWLKMKGRRPGYGVIGSFGPGFSAELLLVRS